MDRDLYELSTRLASLIDPSQARALLSERVGNEMQFLHHIAGDRGVTHEMACKALVAFYGYGVLANPKIRASIIDNLPESSIAELADELEESQAKLPAFRQQLRSYISNRKFVPGSRWARRLCSILNFPLSCAGEMERVDGPPIEMVSPYTPLPPLHSYQLELAGKIIALFEQPRASRAMLSLPTGAGKTRLVMEAVLNWSPVESGQGTLVWVAQHEELCEQAIECVRQVWASQKRPLDRELKIQRVWAGKSAEIDWTADVIVGIPESLSTRLQDERSTAPSRLATTVIDEAHLSTDSTYEQIFRVGSTAPILGLSATPAKTSDPRGALQMSFFGNLITSSELGEHPLQVLREMDVISMIDYREIDNPEKVELSDEDRENTERFGDLPKSVLIKLGRSIQRNRAIYDALLDIPGGRPTLVFMSSVPAARAVAAAMSMSGKTSSVIDATTPRNQRRKVIEQFNSGELQFLFNYEVLAVGFDAPSVEYLVMARPTRSPVLLEQMLGRGIRGPANGGTEMCHVIWIADDFANAESLRPLSYTRFLAAWRT